MPGVPGGAHGAGAVSRYRVTFETTVTIEIDPEVIDRTQTKWWRDQMYRLTPDQAIAMVAQSVAIDGRSLPGMDGWADLPAAAVTVVSRDPPEWTGVEEVR